MQELYKNYIAWLEGKIEDYEQIFDESEYSDKPLTDSLQNMSKDEWLRQTHELIRQHKLPQSPELDVRGSVLGVIYHRFKVCKLLYFL